MQTSLTSLNHFLQSATKYVPTSAQIPESLKSLNAKVSQLFQLGKKGEEFTKYALEGAAIASLTLVPHVLDQFSSTRGIIPVFSSLSTTISGIAFAAFAWPMMNMAVKPSSKWIDEKSSQLGKDTVKYTKELVSKKSVVDKKDKKSLYETLPFQVGMLCWGSWLYMSTFQSLPNPWRIGLSAGGSLFSAYFAKNKLEDLSAWFEKTETFEYLYDVGGRAWNLFGNTGMSILFGAAIGRTYISHKTMIHNPVESALGAVKSSYSWLGQNAYPYAQPVVDTVYDNLEPFVSFGVQKTSNFLSETQTVLSNRTVQRAGLTLIGFGIALYGVHTLGKMAWNFLSPKEEGTTSSIDPSAQGKTEKLEPTPLLVEKPEEMTRAKNTGPAQTTSTESKWSKFSGSLQRAYAICAASFKTWTASLYRFLTQLFQRSAQEKQEPHKK